MKLARLQEAHAYNTYQIHKILTQGCKIEKKKENKNKNKQKPSSGTDSMLVVGCAGNSGTAFMSSQPLCLTPISSLL
jgi:hypothetical protein